MATKGQCLRALACAAFAAGCGSADANEGAAFACQLGSIEGTWRVSYAEVDGTCGPLPDETGIFPSPLPAGCTVQQDAIAPDQCRQDRAFTCPTTDGLGTQQWTAVLHHVEAGRITGTATVQLTHPDAVCRSTYTLTVTRL